MPYAFAICHRLPNLTLPKTYNLKLKPIQHAPSGYICPEHAALVQCISEMSAREMLPEPVGETALFVP